MVSKLFILGFTNIAIIISAQVVNIPNANFKAYLVGIPSTPITIAKSKYLKLFLLQGR